MHFRFRGNNIQVVKTAPDPESGKAISTPMGSINRVTMAISDKLRTNCSTDELREIETWVKRYQAIDTLKHKHAAMTLPEQMAAAAEWFKFADSGEARQPADDIISTMAMLRKVLDRRGLL